MNRNKLLAKLHVLLKGSHADENKDVIYADYGVTTSKDMTDEQICHLISRLEISKVCGRRLSGAERSPARHSNKDEQIKDLRHRALTFLTGNPAAKDPKKRGLGIPNDWDILNPFIQDKAGKLLCHMNIDELHKFNRQIFAIRENGWWYGKKETAAAPVSAPALTRAPAPVSAVLVYTGMLSDEGPVN